MIVTFSMPTSSTNPMNQAWMSEDIQNAFPHLTITPIKDKDGYSDKLSRKYDHEWATVAFHLKAENNLTNEINIFDQAKLAKIACDSDAQVSFIEDADFLNNGLEHPAI